jgi:hypothetical protein
LDLDGHFIRDRAARRTKGEFSAIDISPAIRLEAGVAHPWPD